MAVSAGSDETCYLLPPKREDWGARGIPDFVYGQKELTREGIQWPSTGPPDTPPPLSRFDSALCSAWTQRMELGLFRYRLGELQTQVLPGPLGFVAQLNVERGAQRRRPQNIGSIGQAFDPDQFNFNKIHPGEVLFRLRRREPAPPGGLGPEDVLVVINVSPLERGHVLLVPEPARGLPQRLLPGALRAGLEALLLSWHPGFRVGFNSLGGLASVNHLHLHGYYLARRLPVEGAPSEPLDPRGRLHLLRAVPAPGFLFYASGPGPGLEAVVSRVCRATDYLASREIAHNVFATRGAPPGAACFSPALTGVRVVLWPRKSSFGIKEQEAFNVALCELAGHLPVKTPQDYRGLTEAAALALIQDCLLPPAQAEEVRAALVALTAQEER